MRLERAFDRRFLGYRSVIGWYHWMKAKKRILFGKTNRTFADRLWCSHHGFFPSDLNLFGGDLKKNPNHYLSTRDYYRLHPINGAYSFWIDDKLTMKHVFSRYDTFLPEYYFQTEKSRVLCLPDCPKGTEASVSGIVDLLKQKKRLAAKKLYGGGGVGFYRLEYNDEGFAITGKQVNEEAFRRFLESMHPYLITEYISNHRVIREIWPNALNTMRVLIANVNGELVLMRTFIRFGNAKSNGVDNAHSGGIEAVIDEDTGKILFTQAQDVYGTPTVITEHPDSGVSFDIQIPHWAEIIGQLKTICLDYPQLRYLGFDIAVTEESFKIIEINSLSGLMAAQSKEPLMKDPKTRAVYDYFKAKRF